MPISKRASQALPALTMGPQKMLSYAVVVNICKYDLPSENGCSWLPCFMSMRGISHSSAQMAGLQVKGLRCLQLLFDTEPDPIFFLGANMRPSDASPYSWVTNIPGNGTPAVFSKTHG